MSNYKLVRGFDQIDVKDGKERITGVTNIVTGQYQGGDRFSVWTRINRRHESYSLKDPKELQDMLAKWKAEGFVVVADSTQYKAMRYYK